MNSLFRHDGQLRRCQTVYLLGRNSQELRKREATCRELAETCLTEEARLILGDLADDLGREASEFEEIETSALIAGGL